MVKNPGTGDFSNPIRIRAHHLLCVQGFQGHGYSREFEENMWQIINNLNANYPTYLKLTSECDDICLECPHNHNSSCNESSLSNSHVINMDKVVLEKIGVDEGLIEKSSVIFERVNSIFNNKKNLQEVCSNCIWHSKCSYYQKIMNLNTSTIPKKL